MENNRRVNNTEWGEGSKETALRFQKFSSTPKLFCQGPAFVLCILGYLEQITITRGCYRFGGQKLKVKVVDRLVLRVRVCAPSRSPSSFGCQEFLAFLGVQMQRSNLSVCHHTVFLRDSVWVSSSYKDSSCWIRAHINPECLRLNLVTSMEVLFSNEVVRSRGHNSTESHAFPRADDDVMESHRFAAALLASWAWSS